VTDRLKLEAVVLRTVDYGESDRVVTLFSRERGKLAAFARAARASRRRFGGALEPFTLVTAELTERSGGEGLARLESVNPTSAFPAIRGDLARIGCAAYAVELVRELVRDHEPHPPMFDLLVEYLGRLDAAPARPAGLRILELRVLSEAGFQPRLDACARCGTPVAAEGRSLVFSPSEGGLRCSTCGLDAAPGAVRLTPGALAALRRWQERGFEAEGEPVEPSQAREAREALGRFLEHLIGHRLQARRFLDEVAHALGG
jgi:DNA repair protein RecO (recombination protein O)